MIRKMIFLGFLVSIFVIDARTEKNLVEILHRSVPLTPTMRTALEQLADETSIKENQLIYSNTNSLFNAYPLLKEKIPYINLADLPTPISECPMIAADLQIKQLFIKHDNLTGMIKNGQRLFSGNKVRKLEFLLADALRYNVRSIITFGCVGSNHAIAAAVYAREVGLEPIMMLKPECNSAVVRRNLLLQKQVASVTHYAPNNELRGIQAIAAFLKHKQQYGSFPYVIPTGGSVPLGACGYVNAAFELKEQIDAGLMPIPDRIYVPLGSAGTMVGLLVGFKAAGIKTKIIGVTVEPEECDHEYSDKIMTLFPETNAFLLQADPSFGAYDLSEQDFEIIYNCCGKEYALCTQQAREAINLAKKEQIALDVIYTGKAFAGLIADAQRGELHDKTILFWHTFCDDDFKDIVNNIDYHTLPSCLHCYFEQEIPQENRI